LATGHQPIGNEDDPIQIICNGEIYNYRELSKNLVTLGHTLKTNSDSEVIVHLYEQYSDDCVNHLNGIFSFAIWDRKKRKLLLARDHLGVKPLFYFHDKEKLSFASEIKAILQDPTIKRELNREALYQYLSLNYTPSPLTMFKNIHALRPGHTLVFFNGQVKLSQYWDMSFDENRDIDGRNLGNVVRENIEQSVKMQMVSDVPVGGFLSGGLDSSIIVHFMKKYATQRVKTFNVRFDESSYDESSYARSVSQAYGTDHYEVFCRAEDYLKNISDIIWHADNLTVDISMLPLMLVSRLAKQHVKVVLSGDGADELFAGYPTYAADQFVNYYQRLPKFLKNKMIPGIIHHLPPSEKKMSFEFKAKRFVNGANLSLEEAHYSWRTIFYDQEKKRLLSENMFEEIRHDSFWSYERFYNQVTSKDSLSRHLYADMKVWLVDSILAKVDFMSMAHSLEVRVPFLNPKFVEFATAIPSSYKLKNFIPKYILKEAMKNDIPRNIIKRKKAGFNIPIGKWFRNDLKELLMDTLCKENVNKMDCLNWPYINKLIVDHMQFKKDNGYKLLSLLHFCLWYNTFLKD